MATEVIRPYDHATDAEPLGRVYSTAFCYPVKQASDWLARLGHENIHVLCLDGDIAGGITAIPMGQWFGRRAVPMAAIVGVATDPQYRGRGVARRIMTYILHEARRQGQVISTLYPATQTLYRRAGYELAGGWYETVLPLRAIDVHDRALTIRAALPSDRPTLDALYQQRAQHANGNLQRHDYIWQRIENPRGEQATGYFILNGTTPEGYVYVLQKREHWHSYDLNLTDAVAITPAAGRRLLSFLVDHSSMAGQAVWHGSAFDPVLMHLGECGYTTKLHYHWMLRIVDVAGALSARGYPPDVRGELHLEIEDEILADNAGRFVLHVEGGCGRVEPGGRGTVRMHVRGLAVLYSGYLTPRGLLAAGMLTGETEAIDTASRIFAGPAPWCADQF